ASGFVRAQCDKIWLYSCYLAPSLPLSEFAAIMEEIAEDARGHCPIIIGGDFNAWSVEWGSSKTNARGRTMSEALASLDVALLNTGNNPTFVKAGRSSVIDLTFASSSLAPTARWTLCQGYTASDHRMIICTIGDRSNCRRAGLDGRMTFRVDTLDARKFAEEFRPPNLSGRASGASEAVLAMEESLQSACNASMQTRKPFRNHHSPVYWWNESIAEAR
ncbi:hypothetical protein KR222_005035, partial [Zaprionus bogoriensis]